MENLKEALKDKSLVWSCEFNSYEEFTEKFQFDKSMGNDDFEYNNDINHGFVENNNMVLRVLKPTEKDKVCSLPFGISTKTKMNFKYGYVEMRAKVPFTHGAWPSFWMKTQTPYAKSKFMAETDIFEVFSNKTSLSSNLHKWWLDKHVMLPGEVDSLKRDYTFPNEDTLNDEYHLYGFLWTKDYMEWYIDDEPYFKVMIDGSYDFGAEDVEGMDGFHDFAFIIMNNEAFSKGTGWVSEKIFTKPEDLPIEYRIDYVKLYQNKTTDEIHLENEIKAELEKINTTK